MKSAIITYATCLLAKVISVPCVTEQTVSVAAVEDVVTQIVWVEVPRTLNTPVSTEGGCNSWYCKKYVCKGKRGLCYESKCFCPYEIDTPLELYDDIEAPEHFESAGLCDQAHCERSCGARGIGTCSYDNTSCLCRLKLGLLEQNIDVEIASSSNQEEVLVEDVKAEGRCYWDRWKNKYCCFTIGGHTTCD